MLSCLRLTLCSGPLSLDVVVAVVLVAVVVAIVAVVPGQRQQKSLQLLWLLRVLYNNNNNYRDHFENVAMFFFVLFCLLQIVFIFLLHVFSLQSGMF